MPHRVQVPSRRLTLEEAQELQTWLISTPIVGRVDPDVWMRFQQNAHRGGFCRITFCEGEESFATYFKLKWG